MAGTIGGVGGNEAPISAPKGSPTPSPTPTPSYQQVPNYNQVFNQNVNNVPPALETDACKGVVCPPTVYHKDGSYDWWKCFNGDCYAYTTSPNPILSPLDNLPTNNTPKPKGSNQPPSLGEEVGSVFLGIIIFGGILVLAFITYTLVTTGKMP